MKIAAAIIFALPLGGLALAGLALWRSRAQLAATGWSPSARVLIASRFWGLLFGIPFPLFAAVLHNEGASSPHDTTDDERTALSNLGDTAPPAQIYPMGDFTSSKGPALGPGQVLWILNVQRLAAIKPWWAFFVSTDGAQLVRVGSEFSALYFSARVLQECIAATSSEHDAAAKYNGAGDAAEAYAAKADTFEQEIS